MEAYVWTIAIAAVSAAMLSGLFGLAAVYRFERRFGKGNDLKR